MTIIVYILVAVCVADFVAGMLLGRCVIPGLKCGACRHTDDTPTAAPEGDR